MSLGRRKFSVIAAHSVMMNSTTLRRMYLTARSFSPCYLAAAQALTRWVTTVSSE